MSLKEIGGASPKTWLALILLAAILATPLILLGLPAGMLLGAMAAGIIFGVRGATMGIPPTIYKLAQGTVGVILANSLSPALLGQVSQFWVLLLLVNAVTLVLAFTAGWTLNRMAPVPRPEAILGSLPGMASAMVIIAQERDTDSRVVALMQYLRLATVIVALSVLSALLPGEKGAVVAASQPMLQGPAAAALLVVIALLGLPAAKIRRLPAAAMLVPMAIAAVAELSGVVHVQMPTLIRDVVFLVLGLQVGLRFTRPILVQMLRLVPAILGSSCLLLSLSALLAFFVSLLLGTDYLTAFLITAPGSIDTVVMLAAASHANVSLVLAFQTVRLLAVVLVGPILLERVGRLPIWRERHRPGQG